MCGSFSKLSRGLHSDLVDASSVPSLPEREQSDAEVANYLKDVSWIWNVNHCASSSENERFEATLNHLCVPTLTLSSTFNPFSAKLI